MLKATGAAERAIWSLVRWAIAVGGPARRIGEAVVDEIHPPAANDVLPGQLALWVKDREDLPERPWRIEGPERIACLALGCTLTAKECVFRQMVSDIQRTQDTERGQSSEYPSCVTAKCEQGAGVREALAPADTEACQAKAQAARNRDRDRRSTDKARQMAAKRSKALVGLVDEVSTIDGGEIVEE